MTPEQRDTLAAAMDRVLPSDHGPGAATANAIGYVDALVAAGRDARLQGPLTRGLALLDGMAMAMHGQPFARCTAAARDAVLRALHRAPHRTTRDFAWLLTRLTLRGFLCDPRHGGNAGGVGWTHIGFVPSPASEGPPSSVA